MCVRVCVYPCWWRAVAAALVAKANSSCMTRCKIFFVSRDLDVFIWRRSDSSDENHSEVLPIIIIYFVLRVYITMTIDNRPIVNLQSSFSTRNKIKCIKTNKQKLWSAEIRSTLFIFIHSFIHFIWLRPQRSIIQQTIHYTDKLITKHNYMTDIGQTA